MLKGWWSPSEAADVAGDHLPKVLPAVVTSLKLIFLITTTTLLRYCLPNLLLPVRSLSPSINFFEIVFLFTMLNEGVSGENHT
jgi:hypothetical protein